MHGPPFSPAEIRQILKRTVERRQRAGLGWDAGVAATAREYGATEYKVAALVETERPPTGLVLVAN